MLSKNSLTFLCLLIVHFPCGTIPHLVSLLYITRFLFFVVVSAVFIFSSCPCLSRSTILCMLWQVFRIAKMQLEPYASRTLPCVCWMNVVNQNTFIAEYTVLNILFAGRKAGIVGSFQQILPRIFNCWLFIFQQKDVSFSQRLVKFLEFFQKGSKGQVFRRRFFNHFVQFFDGELLVRVLRGKPWKPCPHSQVLVQRR